jgi:hypothetical protein
MHINSLSTRLHVTRSWDFSQRLLRKGKFMSGDARVSLSLEQLWFGDQDVLIEGPGT